MAFELMTLNLVLLNSYAFTASAIWAPALGVSSKRLFGEKIVVLLARSLHRNLKRSMVRFLLRMLFEISDGFLIKSISRSLAKSWSIGEHQELLKDFRKTYLFYYENKILIIIA